MQKKHSDFRKFICLVLAALMCISVCLTGCGTAPEDETPPIESEISSSDNGEDNVSSSSDQIANTTSGSDTIDAETPDVIVDVEDDKKDSTESVVPSELSDDPFSFQVAIDDNIIQLPCKVSDLAAIGWVMDEDKADNTLDEGYTTVVTLRNGDDSIVASIYNDGDVAVKYADAMIDDLSFYARSFENHKVVVCGGLTLGSTKEDVIAVYGDEPTREYHEEGSAYSNATYEGKDFLHKVEFAFMDDVVSEISIYVG